MARSSGTPVAAARAVMGEAMLAPEDVGRTLGIDPGTLSAATPELLQSVPYDEAALRAARDRGELLVFRIDADATGPLTVLRLLAHFPDAIDPKLLKGVGYLLKDEWTLDQEPFTASETCRLEWRLVHRDPIHTTLNLPYEAQEAALARYAAGLGAAGKLSRRRAVESVYDSLLFDRAHRVRLLATAWDWSATPTLDGGFATVGEFGSHGLHVLGYSRAVRFGTLGVCAQR